MTAHTVMADEIREQPATLAATIDALVSEMAVLRHLVRGCRTIWFYARGSSDTAAIYGRYLCEIQAGIPSGLGAPSTATLYGTAPDLRDSLAVVLSQSGQTTELVEVAHWASDRGARVIAVTNDPRSPLAEAADHPLVTRAGTEVAVPATKTHTAQLAAMVVIAASLLHDPDPLLAGLAGAPAEAARLLEDTVAAEAAGAALVQASAVVVSGRSYTLSTAFELTLKLQETCGLAAVGLSAADLQHGPSALERPDIPLLLAAPPAGPVLPAIASCARTARRRGSPVYAIGGDAGLAAMVDFAIPGPALPEALAPVVGVIPGQILVEALARGRGLDPDRPGGLTKVTQTAQ